MQQQAVSNLLRQEVFDFLLPDMPVMAKATVKPRLVIMACSATKVAGDGLTAMQRYDGPVWQTLRSADPERQSAVVMVLSARFGLRDAQSLIPDYNTVLTAKSADAMIERGLCGYYPAYDMSFRTEASLLRHLAKRDALSTPAGELVRALRKSPKPIEEIAIVGGKHYVRVAQALVDEMKREGFIDASVEVTVINDQIGYMRAQLKRWIARP